MYPNAGLASQDDPGHYDQQRGTDDMTTEDDVQVDHNIVATAPSGITTDTMDA